MKRVIALAVVLAVLLTPSARADGDPASDTLLFADVFFPYAPATSPDLKKALQDTIAQAKKAGFPVKVALIESANDLGAYPQMYNQAQQYADLLYSELPGPTTGGGKTPIKLLVVMPAGFGGKNLGDGVDQALGPIKVNADAQSDGLSAAAIVAVARLATAAGHPVKVPPIATKALGKSSKSTKGKGTSPLPFVIPIVLLAALGIVAFLRGKRDADDDDPPESDDE